MATTTIDTGTRYTVTRQDGTQFTVSLDNIRGGRNLGGGWLETADGQRISIEDAKSVLYAAARAAGGVYSWVEESREHSAGERYEIHFGVAPEIDPATVRRVSEGYGVREYPRARQLTDELDWGYALRHHTAQLVPTDTTRYVGYGEDCGDDVRRNLREWRG